MLTYIEVKFFFDSECLSESLGQKWLKFCKNSPGCRCRRETSEMSRLFVLNTRKS